MKNMLKFLFLFFTVFISYFANAQKDTEFWFVAPEISKAPPHLLDSPIVFRIVNFETPSTVTFSQPAGGGMPDFTVDIPSNTDTTISLDEWLYILENIPVNAINNKGIKVVSTNPITIYYEVVTGAGIMAPRQDNPEVFTLKGKNALGTFFSIPGQNILSNSDDAVYVPSAYTAFDIVASEDNTTVSIAPSNNIEGHTAGIVFEITLNEGQTYSAASTERGPDYQLVGSTILSDKPIAVTYKNDMLQASTPYLSTCADLTGDQLIPVAHLGNEYIAVQGQLNGPNSYIFVTAIEDESMIYKNGILLGTIDANETLSFPVSTDACYIYSNNIINVWQLSGIGCEFGATQLPTINCTGSNRVSYIRSMDIDLYLNLIIRSGHEDDFEINGNPSALTTGDFYDVPGTSGEWRYAIKYLELEDYPQGNSIEVTNSSSVFHLGVLDGGPISGTSLGYFSNYGQVYLLDTIVDICAGDSYNFYGTEYNETGTYTLMSSEGSCDTIKELVLTVHSPTRTETTLQLCASDLPYTYYDIIIPPGTMSTIKFDSVMLVSATGCDSLIVLNVNIIPSSIFYIDTLLCVSESLLIGDVTITEAGIYSILLENTMGCDSTVEVFVSYLPDVIIKDTLLIGCSHLTYNGIEYFSSVTLRDTFRNQKNCDSFIFNHVIQIINEPKDTIYRNICEGESYRFMDHLYTESTTITENFPRESGCDSFITLVLTVHPEPDLSLIYEMLDIDQEHCVFDSILLKGVGAEEYYYYDQFGALIGNGNEIEVALLQLNNGYQVIGYNEYSCADTAAIQIIAQPCCNVLLPSAFSPNGDGLNDGFGPVTLGNLLNYQLQIFNRWGERVYISFDSREKWSGLDDNKKAESGVYFYLLTGTCYDGNKLQFKGDVILLR